MPEGVGSQPKPPPKPKRAKSRTSDFYLDMRNRDPHNLNSHVKVSMDEKGRGGAIYRIKPNVNRQENEDKTPLNNEIGLSFCTFSKDPDALFSSGSKSHVTIKKNTTQITSTSE